MTSPSLRRAFLNDEFFGLTLNATVQRADIYRIGTADAERDPFRAALHKELARLAATYSARISDEAHVANILRLADKLSDDHEAVLREGRFRVGPAQKALNLKYQWCDDQLPEPPHCPFDSRVINLIPSQRYVRWTDLDSPDQYRRLVDEARSIAGGLSLAVWELTEYHKLSNASRRSI